jgi:NAD(P)-dependent dehydrogenase (short-subunit alcohol dehydrogenase family)
MIDVVYLGHLHLVTAMHELGMFRRGAIICTILTNNLCLRPAPVGYLGYACAKAALAEMGRVLAAESLSAGWGVAVAEVVLGAVRTEAFEAALAADPALAAVPTFTPAEAMGCVFGALTTLLSIPPQNRVAAVPYRFEFDRG